LHRLVVLMPCHGAAALSLALLSVLLGACQEPTASDASVLPRVPAEGQLGGPMPLTADTQRAKFARGAALFNRVFTPETGLGPLFNGSSCAECHGLPVPGGSGLQVGVRVSTFRDGVCNELTDVGGPVIQLAVTPALHDALGIDREPVPAGASVAYRTTPSVWGTGLLDAVPDSEILALADPDDRDHDGVSGRPNWTADHRLGRFGRKAQSARLWDFVAEAYMMEMGIKNERFPLEQLVAGQPLPPGVEPVAGLEITTQDMIDADWFERVLAPPSFAGSDDLHAQGLAIFSRVGCAACHVPALRTRAHPIASMSNQVFFPYTDLLLHDMGPDLADICMGQALPEEFRTEPLWGLRFRLQFLHDGRAKTIAAAIDLHGGEANGARERYLALSEQERAILLSFLGNL
jgi:CxxC motif-containing protein (DUF1111 family)